MAVSAILDKNGTNYFQDARRQLFNKSILLSEVWPVPTIMACYLIFIFVGNRIMEKRKPFHLKFPMLAFNIFQISYNLYMFCRCLCPEVLSYVISHTCHPMDPAKNGLCPEGFAIAHLFLVSKLLDLIDTVFLVLRKKVEHISFLHLYHHFVMATISWTVLRYYDTNGEQVYIIVLLNPLVHVIMYFYYLLSLLGPSIRKYLWWKKYVTVLQLAQFVIYIIHMVALLVHGCTQPKDMSLLIFSQGIVFFALFKNFYDEHYKNPSSSAVESTDISENKKK